MTSKIFAKIQTHVQVFLWEGGREQALEICRWVGKGSMYIPKTREDPREYLQIPTMFGPRDIKAGQYVVKIDNEQFLTYKPEALLAEYVEILDNDHPLVKHARTELAMFPNEDTDFIESLVAAVKGFSAYRGHSGISQEIAVHMISALLAGKNLLPLTDDLDEWELHLEEDEDIWQNRRNNAAFSYDGGVTYFLATDSPNEIRDDAGEVVDTQRKFYPSQKKDFTPAIDQDELTGDVNGSNDDNL